MRFTEAYEANDNVLGQNKGFPTDVLFLKFLSDRALEPGCRILVFMWSFGRPILAVAIQLFSFCEVSMHADGHL